MRYALPSGLDLVAWVRSEYRTQYREGAERVAMSLDDRIDSGGTIAGLRVVGHDRDTTVLACQENTSKLRVGDTPYVHPEDEPVDLATAMPWGSLKARIIERSADGLQLTVAGDLAAGTTWCLDSLPNAWNPLSARPAAICAGFDTTHAVAKRWKRWLTGKASTGPSGVANGPRLTDRQRQALHRALHDELTVIQGPPGTGKTHLIAALLERLVQDGQRVLVTCFSHAAIENVLLAVVKRNHDIACFRVGKRGAAPIAGIEDLDGLPKATVPGVYGMTVFAAAKPWATAVLKAAGRLEQPADGSPIPTQDYLESYAGAWSLAKLPTATTWFDVLVIDEASQMSLPHSLMAMLHGERCVVVGDHRQLPPVAQSVPTFAPSVFDQLIESYPITAIMLDRTFRMNTAICASPSRLFYGAGLASDPKVAKALIRTPVETPPPAQPTWLAACLDPAQPVHFVSVPTDTGTDCNEAEAAIVGALAAQWLARGLGGDVGGIAVVCANRRQNLAVQAATERAIAALPKGQRARAAKGLGNLLCDTVERIQGQERDCILVSLTGSDPEHLARQWIFSHCPRRFNVAITRPRTKLTVVGSPAFFHFTPPTGDGDTLSRLTGIAALKRWYLDRLDAGEIVEVRA